MNYRLYKDAEPADTIYRIKMILSKNRIFVDENVTQSFDGIFCARITIDGLDLGTNGKGVSKDAALASAYAELMERIQNFALYKYLYPAKNETCDAKFYYAPDEKTISHDEYLKCVGRFKKAINIDGVTVDDLASLNTKYERDNGVVFCVPYVNFDSKEQVFFPARLSEHIYASNGMAAGNTYTEALVQSISEIFERYANKIIHEGKTTPPDIQLEDINFSSEMRNVVTKLGRTGNYAIKFKDCSLGKGLPVVGMYFIDKATGKYFVKFGCHPILSVAAERTITELFQGRDLPHANLWLNVFTFETNVDADINFERMFRSGDGVYPYALFAGAGSYEFSNCWCKTKDADNEFYLSFLLDIVRKNGWSLFHRDVSFLGFPSLHAFIPEISSIVQINSQYLRKQLKHNSIKECVKKLNQCSRQELIGIVNFIDSNSYNEFDNIKPLVGLPLSKDASFDKMNNLCFKYLLCCKAGEYQKGIENLDKFIKDGYIPMEEVAFYRCLKEATYALYITKIDAGETESILGTMFNADIVNRATSILRHHEFETFNCFECHVCLSQKTCRYPQILKFDESISQKYLLWNN